VEGRNGTPRKFVLRNKKGMEVAVTNVGAALLSVKVPRYEKGEMKKVDVLLGRENPENVDKGSTKLGCVIGPCVHISRGKFDIDGNTYQLECNDDRHHSYGGSKGLSSRIFDVEYPPEVPSPTYGRSSKPPMESKAAKVVFRCTGSEDEWRYPGTLTTQVTFLLNDSNELVIDIKALVEGKAAPVNIAYNTFWNLGGHTSGSVLNAHCLHVQPPLSGGKNFYTKPSGEYKQRILDEPEEVPKDFDFTRLRFLKESMDHNFVLRFSKPDSTNSMESPCATLLSPISRLRMEVYTNQVGLQVITFEENKENGKHRNPYSQHGGVCLRPQAFPDAVNMSCFPSVVVRPAFKMEQDTKGEKVYIRHTDKDTLKTFFEDPITGTTTWKKPNGKIISAEAESEKARRTGTFSIPGGFSSPEVDKGSGYHHKTVYKFASLSNKPSPFFMSLESSVSIPKRRFRLSHSSPQLYGDMNHQENEKKAGEGLVMRTYDAYEREESSIPVDENEVMKNSKVSAEGKLFDKAIGALGGRNVKADEEDEEDI